MPTRNAIIITAVAVIVTAVWLAHGRIHASPRDDARGLIQRVQALESRTAALEASRQVFKGRHVFHRDDFGQPTRSMGWRIATHDIAFDQPFSVPPVVFVSINRVRFEQHKGSGFTYIVDAREVTENGFQLRAIIGHDEDQPRRGVFHPEHFRDVHVSWIAIPGTAADHAEDPADDDVDADG